MERDVRPTTISFGVSRHPQNRSGCSIEWLKKHGTRLASQAYCGVDATSFWPTISCFECYADPALGGNAVTCICDLVYVVPLIFHLAREQQPYKPNAVHYGYRDNDVMDNMLIAIVKDLSMGINGNFSLA